MYIHQKLCYEHLQACYSTRSTTPIGPPAAYATYLACDAGDKHEGAFADGIRRLREQDFRLIPLIPTFISGWDQSLQNTFDRAWWRGAEVDWAAMIHSDTEGGAYFQVHMSADHCPCRIVAHVPQGLWGNESPLDLQANLELDEEERKVLARLSALLSTERDVTHRLQHNSSRIAELSKLLGIDNIPFNPGNV